MRLNLSQRWTLLMISLAPSLFKSENSESDFNVSTATKSINSIGNTAKVPKTHTQFATLFAQHANKLRAINSLSAADKIDLLQTCGAHKEPDKLSQLLVCSHVLQLAIQHRQMMLALNSFHAIGMTDIASDLKGPAIGAALRQSRIDHLQAHG